MRVVRVIIRVLGFRVDSVAVIVVPNKEMVFLKVGILRIHPISHRVSLVKLFRKHFRLLMAVSLVLEINLVRAVASL